MTQTGLRETGQQIRSAIDRYLLLFTEHPADEREKLRQLALALDNLVEVYFSTSDVDPDGDVDAPRDRFDSYYRRAAKAFPELGYYPSVDPGGEPGVEKCGVGDAIDDLGDIAADMQEVLWHLDHSSVEEAIWHYRFGYQTHWGDHLHSLRYYLNSTRIGAW